MLNKVRVLMICMVRRQTSSTKRRLSNGTAMIYSRKDDRNDSHSVVWDELAIWGLFALISELPFLKTGASESLMWRNRMLGVTPVSPRTISERRAAPGTWSWKVTRRPANAHARQRAFLSDNAICQRGVIHMQMSRYRRQINPSRQTWHDEWLLEESR